MISEESLQALEIACRRDDILDELVPSDLRIILNHLREARSVVYKQMKDHIQDNLTNSIVHNRGILQTYLNEYNLEVQSFGHRTLDELLNDIDTT